MRFSVLARSAAAALALVFMATSLPAAAGGQAAASLEDRIAGLIDEGRGQDAAALAREQAARGDPVAQDILGLFYERGEYVAQDMEQALALYRRAADAGMPHAQWRLGVAIDMGEAAGTLEQAFALFTQAAEAGFSNAYVSLGVMMSTGRGTAQDHVAALESYKAAARMGNAHAFNEIGVVYENGEGVATDILEASAWYMIAMYLGDDTAQQNFGRMTAGFDDDQLDGIAVRAHKIAVQYGAVEAEIPPVT